MQAPPLPRAGPRYGLTNSSMDRGKPIILDRANAKEPPGSVAEARTLSSADLFSGAKEVVIDHQGERYRLRCTSKGKLILTK